MPLLVAQFHNYIIFENWWQHLEIFQINVGKLHIWTVFIIWKRLVKNTSLCSVSVKHVTLPVYCKQLNNSK